MNDFVTCKATGHMFSAVIHNFRALKTCNLGLGEWDEVKDERPTSNGINLP